MKLTRTVGLLAALGMLAAACGGGAVDPSETTTTAATAATTSAPDETGTTAMAAGSDDGTTTTAQEATGVQVADSELGEILVGPDGFTLYVFTADEDGESVCYDECADLWPAVPADTPIAPDLDAAMFDAVARDDGSEQLTVNGMPLYRYNEDTAPGDVNGHGFNDVWFAVEADGSMVGDTTDDSIIDYGY